MVGTVGRVFAAVLALPLFASGFSLPAKAEAIARSQQAAGAVIARKVGEEVRFVDISDWQFVDLKQDLVAGDVLRTNGTGQLAILFSDRTQVRLGRNSSLVVKQITSGTSADTILQLETGTIWARAERGGPGVKVETPAAAAAIRGTDWTMTVQGAKTSLNVLEGFVQLSNPQGSVEVRQGEGAVASIGQAPRKLVIVDSDDREQMLYYLAPRNAFNFMPASPLAVSQMRREADRVAGVPMSSRTAEDTLVLAETSLSLEGRDKAKAALETLPRQRLSLQQRARAELVRAIIAAGDRRYEEAAKLFAAAAPRLDSRRRGIAVYGGYYARSLAHPNRVEAAPVVVNGPYDALLKAYAAGFLEDIPAAIEVIRKAERQFPDDPTLPAFRGQLAMLINDRRQVDEALTRSLELDPLEPTALEGRANYRADFKGDIEGALVDLTAAAKVAPGSTTIWNAIGNVQAERGDNRSAEEAFRKSIALDPQDPVGYSNLASFYLGQSRVKEAKALIDKALTVDPGFDLGLIDRGRYHLQTGDLDKATNDMLAGTVANPAYSQGQTLLAATHYEKGDRVAAAQALDNADRLDDNDPTIAAFRTTVAIDEYDADGAIRNAQDFLKRSRSRGGHYASLGASQDAGSTLNGAFQLQGMDAWGQYYGDVVFDPFSGTSYFDQSIRGSADPFANNYVYGDDVINNVANGQAFSALLQGLLLEPHAISGRSRSANILRLPFLEGSIGGGVTAAGDAVGYTAEGEVQGYANLLFPISFYTNLQWQEVPDSRDIDALSDLETENRVVSGTAYLTASPTAYDRFVAYYSDLSPDLSRQFTIEADPSLYFPGGPFPLIPLTTTQNVSSRATSAGLGWSHTVGYENVINAALLYSGLKSEDSIYREFEGPVPIERRSEEFRQKSYIASVNHMIGAGDLTWRYGVEGGRIDASQSQLIENLRPFIGGATSFTSASDQSTVARIYVDLLHEITEDLKAEYALFATHMQSDASQATRLEPRVGLAWTPAEGHWLRAGFMRSSIDLTTPTLSPIAIVGLQPNQISVGTDGYVDTYAARWDAEWTPDLFTAVEYQHQDLDDPRIAVPLASTPFTTGEGRLDRASATTNILLGHGFGLSSTLVYTHSEDEDPASPTFGGPLPFVPEWGGQVALTWVNEANIKTTVAANYVGDRVGEGGSELDDYWTLDARVVWEPFDKRFELELAAYNLLDEEIEVDNGVPGWGRSFTGSFKVRF